MAARTAKSRPARTAVRAGALLLAALLTPPVGPAAAQPIDPERAALVRDGRVSDADARAILERLDEMELSLDKRISQLQRQINALSRRLETLESGTAAEAAH